MNNRMEQIKFKTFFRNLNYYSMPISILFIVRKRLNFVFMFVMHILIFLYIIV